MMNKVLSGIDEPQSWAQSIQAYQRARTTLSWNSAEVPPPTYVKQFDVSRKSREVDPVLMRHRDPEVEAKRRQREEDRLRAALNKAKTRQLKVEQNYDIVNHRSHVPKAAAEAAHLAKPRHPDTRTAYDILNHVPIENAHSIALIYSEGESPEVLPRKAVTLEGGKKPHSHYKRDVDVLSNRYLEKHDERMLEERNFLREQAEGKYWLTHNYNLIAGKYYDEKKEQDFVNTREELEAIQGRAQQHRLPPSIRFGEGNEYDIINKQTKGPTTKVTSGGVADRGLSKRTRGREAYEENVRQHQQAAAVNEERALNRPSHQRHAERIRTGHDVISNQNFSGRGGRPPPSPRARPPLSVWDRLAGTRSGPAPSSRQREGNVDENTGICGIGEASSRAISEASDLDDLRHREVSGGAGECNIDGKETSKARSEGVEDGTTTANSGQHHLVPPLNLSRGSVEDVPIGG